MATINQIRANRRNAQRSTGPTTPEGKDAVRFNALVHGLRAESPLIPGEDRAKFDDYLQLLSAAWHPQDEMEKSLVEQIAVTQWKLARLDRAEVKLYEDGPTGPEFALSIHRHYLTQIRLQHAISSTIADLQRYRKIRLERLPKTANPDTEVFRQGVIMCNTDGKCTYAILPSICGLDGQWRDLPREVLADPTIRN
jgi:hypothetical protein